MATLTIRDVPDEVHERLKARAERNRRSLNSETVLRREVELVTTEGLSPYIGPKILEEAELVTIDD